MTVDFLYNCGTVPKSRTVHFQHHWMFYPLNNTARHLPNIICYCSLANSPCFKDNIVLSIFWCYDWDSSKRIVIEIERTASIHVCTDTSLSLYAILLTMNHVDHRQSDHCTSKRFAFVATCFTGSAEKVAVLKACCKVFINYLLSFEQSFLHSDNSCIALFLERSYTRKPYNQQM